MKSARNDVWIKVWRKAENQVERQISNKIWLKINNTDPNSKVWGRILSQLFYSYSTNTTKLVKNLKNNKKDLQK